MPPFQVASWIEGFFDVGKIIPRVDAAEGNYIADLKSDPAIGALMKSFAMHLSQNQNLCNEYRAMYMQFEDLWNKDRNVEFREFLISERYKPWGGLAVSDPGRRRRRRRPP